MNNRKLKSLRAFYGIPQRVLAELLGCTLNTYSTKERGLTPFLQSEMIEIVRFFKQKDLSISMDDIFFIDIVTETVTKASKTS